MTRLIRPALLASALTLTAAAAQAITLVGITSANEVVRFDTAAIGGETRTAITGLAAGERLVGIDTRPSNALIYGVSTANKVYTLNEMTGAASFVVGLGTNVINPALGYGIDFNPVADFSSRTNTAVASLRLVSSAGSNFAVNVASGVVGNQASNIGNGLSGAAYTNASLQASSAPASTALYYIDSSTDLLKVAPGSFNAPVISTVGALGVDALKANGFEITGAGQAYAALTVDGATLSTGIYSINLGTGAATLLGEYNGTLAGLTVSAVPEPASYGLMLAGLLAVGGIARRRAR